MATRTIADGGGNYNSTGTWVEGAVPTSADDVVATATSGALTVTAAAAAKTLVLTGYVSTLTINSGFTLTVSGSVTLASGMTYAGAGTLAANATATLTANGITASGGLTLATAVTYTLADNWSCSGLLTTGPASGITTINGYQISAAAGWTSNRTDGTTAIILVGTGTWAGNAGYARHVSTPITINTAGTITLSAASSPHVGGNTVTYTAGTIVSTNSTIYIFGNTSFSGAWPTLESLNIFVDSVVTVNNNFTINGTLRVFSNVILTFAGAYTIQVAALSLDSGSTLKLPNSQTVIITTAIQAGSVSATTTIRSTTASTSSTLTYNGTQANMKIAWCTFADITATNPLWNHWGGTLTRTSGITNVSYTPGDYTDPGEAQVATGTSYLYQGATKNGSYAGGGGSVIVVED